MRTYTALLPFTFLLLSVTFYLFFLVLLSAILLWWLLCFSQFPFFYFNVLCHYFRFMLCGYHEAYIKYLIDKILLFRLRLILSSLTYMDPIIFLYLQWCCLKLFLFMLQFFKTKLKQLQLLLFFFSAFPPPSYAMNVKVLVTQLYLALCDLMDHSPPGSPVHGILQARILEWVAIPFFRGSFPPRDATQVSCITGRFFTVWATREALQHKAGRINQFSISDVGNGTRRRGWWPVHQAFTIISIKTLESDKLKTQKFNSNTEDCGHLNLSIQVSGPSTV